MIEIVLKRGLFIRLLLAVLLMPLVAAAQGTENQEFGLFSDDQILKVKLSFDIGKFMKEKPEEEYLDAKISIENGEGRQVNEDIRVRARGNYRRRTCMFPPVMLNFKGVETGYPDIDKLEKVKLVSHCMPEDRYTTYVLREYLAYKVYNVITDYSFRVRLMDVSYYDINHDTLFASRKAFILEPVDKLEDRFGYDEIEDIEISYDDVDDYLLMKISVFQYLIGNSDWLIPTIHNLKVFGDEDKLQDIIPVPYDFDYTGWVNTHYSVPREDLGLEEIRDRAFLGPCRSQEDYREVMNYYLGLKDKIIDTVKDFKYLKGAERADLKRYVRSFYRLYRKDEILDIFMNPCKEDKQ